MNKTRLILEDGAVFDGYQAGYNNSVSGEVVFATGMVGYEQSLTDPSYSGQILAFTYPLIGNWGVPIRKYWESEKIQVQGVIISDLTTNPNHRLAKKTLNNWLVEQKIPAIVDVDTRLLTQKLRDEGVMLGKIIMDNNDIDFWDPNQTNLVAKVSPKTIKIHKPKIQPRRLKAQNLRGCKVGLLNCGAKRNILRSLLSRGATVYELPWNFDLFENNLKIDGLVISNGPGDPKIAKESIAIIKKSLAKKIPTFGICLGNQLLGLAAGGDTYKLKFGHRAQNQPTIQVGTPPRLARSSGEAGKRCFITTQNHGFALSEKKLPKGFKRWFYNANDNTNEGIIHVKLPFFSVQFHPEATPGPTDTQWLFDFFMEKFK